MLMLEFCAGVYTDQNACHYINDPVSMTESQISDLGDHLNYIF